MTDEEYKKALRQFHKETKRHTLVVETDMPQGDAQKVFALSNRIRKAGNELVALMKRNYHQLKRTKRYRKLLILYGKTKDKDKTLKKKYAKQLQEMQEEYNVTWDFCWKEMIHIGKKYSLHSVFARTKAKDIWKGIESCLYSDGETIHFTKYGEYPCIRAEQVNNGIVISVKDGMLFWKLGKTKFGIKVKDRFQQDELDAIFKYMQNHDNEDMFALNEWLNTGKIVDTYRPCYATLVPKKIRGKYRVFLHLCIEGKAMPKFDKHGKPRHKYGTGVIGVDIGTQTVAYTSETKVGLKNLAERGPNIAESERQERILNRAMDRSRRAMNPQNYNEDGTIKKGHKVWRSSKRYKKIRYHHAELCRKNAINRKLANNEDVNYLRSLGDIFITEPKNASRLMKRAKETTVNEKTGRINRKKRFGKSIQNRCPGYFQAKAQQLFESTGLYVEVSNDYRASQYDHTADDYIKKKLSQRMFKLADGTEVQRDWYSSFLLYCYSFKTSDINRSKCIAEFSKQLIKEKALIEEIKTKKIKVMNSGIKIAE